MSITSLVAFLVTNELVQDTFGPFSDSAAVPGTNSNVDPFGLPTSGGATEEMIEESSFDTFGDFGDFQSAGSVSSSGAISPTPGSWSFDSSGSLDEHMASTKASSSGNQAKEQERTGKNA